ncbi:MAG: hypothetical protein COV29_03535 [Candidatus Yanofskybacteria bacterium CG10_big_fil_rev_8_21_14_0_10_36_16]|uniref:General secretion pathway GspH domain-containing protein n=1 Tax=Candidatus Yanofskybacteria bacterium CG10_big_fil_rev_8_21_14_0_10_36_16 TaxID=1975096 RepID=A0A2J0Q9V9_9BACT|nr:MAG: hypothetical protein COV29_03535 [Candidatus Yanofskybacteria bacterium CG10_big_fil_rev_8_21_14_0_10_36_16]
MEVVFSMAIISLIASLGLFLSMDFYRGYAFSAERDTAVSVLHRARAKAMANINESKHGVKIEDDRYVLFQTDSDFIGRDSSYDQNIPFEQNTVFSGDTNVVIFNQLSGNTGFVSNNVILISDGFKIATISINFEGGIDY